jgi:serine O-acetyltransferase
MMEENIPALIAAVLESYHRTGGINNIDGTNLPSKRAVAQICEDLLQILFPGYHDEEPVANREIEKLTTERLLSVIDRLKGEAMKSLRIQEPGCPEARAQAIVLRLVGQLPEVRQILRTDVEAAYEGDPASASYEEILLSYPSIEAIAIQRLAHILHEERLPIIPRVMTEWAHSRTGIDIHPGAEIGPYFFIDHGTGVVIGETCRIGAHVKLYDGVTLGARSFPKDESGRIKKGGKRHPDVEDWVTIYAKSTILGGGTVIGARSTIGANVFLMESIPPDSLVMSWRSSINIVSKKDRGKDRQPASAPEFPNYDI